MGVAAHRRRDGRRRHAVPRRLGLDGGDAERERDPPRDPADHARPPGRGGPAARGRRRGRAARVADPRRDRPAGRARGARADPCRPLPRPRRRARCGRGLADDARARPRRRSRSSRAAPLSIRTSSRRPAACSSGWTTATSPSSAIASTRSSPRTGRTCCAPCPARASASCAPTDERPISVSFAQLPPEVRRLAREKSLLSLTKANSRATVHRPAYLDYVGVKRFDDSGEVSGERRFLGLYTHTAYSASPWEIPVLRRKAQRVVERSGLLQGSHDHKALVEILENYPRDELFQISEDELLETALGILHLGERRRVRLFVRRDAFERFLSCLVYLPRERFDTENRQRIQDILQEAFGGTSVDYTTRVSESVLARLHVVVYTEQGAIPEYDVGEIEARLAEATRAWTDDLRDALSEQLGEERARAALRALRRRVPRRLPRGLLRPPGGARHRADRAARPRRRPRHEPLRSARVDPRPPRVQAAPLRAAAPPLRRAAAAREHGRQGQRRAAVRGQAGRRAAGLDLRLRAAPRRRSRVPGGRRARDVPGRVRPHLARRGRERRLQPSRPRRRG